MKKALRILGLTAVALGMAIMAAWGWFLMGLVFGRSHEALVYGALSAAGGVLLGFWGRTLGGEGTEKRGGEE